MRVHPYCTATRWRMTVTCQGRNTGSGPAARAAARKRQEKGVEWCSITNQNPPAQHTTSTHVHRRRHTTGRPSNLQHGVQVGLQAVVGPGLDRDGDALGVGLLRVRNGLLHTVGRVARQRVVQVANKKVPVLHVQRQERAPHDNELHLRKGVHKRVRTRREVSAWRESGTHKVGTSAQASQAGPPLSTLPLMQASKAHNYPSQQNSDDIPITTTPKHCFTLHP
jgi:hypothetical protein